MSDTPTKLRVYHDGIVENTPHNSCPIFDWTGDIPVEIQARAQIGRVSRLPFVTQMAVMPDCHYGMGATIGTVIQTEDAIIPAAVGVDIGCVDADTEFLTSSGWKKISEYAEGDDVLVYDVSSMVAFFEIPKAYILKPSKGFHVLKTKYGLNQMLSPEHRVLTYKAGRKREFVKSDVILASDIAEMHHSKVLGFGNYFLTTPETIESKNGVMWSDDEIRARVMLAADGHIESSAAFVFSFRKQRKIERARQLLKAAGWTIISDHLSEDGVTQIFRVRNTGISIKNLGLPPWWELSNHQLRVVAEEVLYWDGNHDEHCFYTSKEAEADFVQWAFMNAGYRAVKRVDERLRYAPRKSSTEYRVFGYGNVKIGMKSTDKTSGISEKLTPSVDGQEYCFTTSTGFFLIRRAGVTCITGNCGITGYRTNISRLEIAGKEDAIRALIQETIPSGRTANGSDGDVGKWGTKYPRPAIVDNKLYDLMPEYLDLTDGRYLSNLKHPHVEDHLGTLGTGNHFIEIAVEEPPDTSGAGIAEGLLWVLVHSGSRGPGARFANFWMKEAKRLAKLWHISLEDPDLAYLPEGTEDFKLYWDHTMWALRYAKASRHIMATLALEALEKFTMLGGNFIDPKVDTSHNYVEAVKGKKKTFITRKGASKALVGELSVMPGSMGTHTYIVEGKSNPKSLFSCSHGAGRAMSRTEAIKTFTPEDHLAATEGVWCRKDLGVLDETPRAYKDIEQVLAQQDELVSVRYTLSPVINIKG